jgi:hypothetical protein
MAAATLKFEGGELGVERCEDGGKQYLRAFVHHAGTGRTASAPIENDEAQRFALDVMKQAVFALGYTEDDLIKIGLEKILEDITAETAQSVPS